MTAVAWLARKVESFGVRLRAGDIVLPGSCTRAIDAPPGEQLRRRIRRPRVRPVVFRVKERPCPHQPEGKCRHCRFGQHQHRPAVQTAALGLAGTALDGRHRPGKRGPGAGSQAGAGDHPRRCRLAAGAVRETRPGVRGDQRLRAPGRGAEVRGRGNPGHRPDAGRGRSGGDPAGEPARTPRRTQRQHDHLRGTGDDPDRLRGQSRARRQRGSPLRRDRRLGVVGHRPVRAPGPTSTSSPRRPARASRPSAARSAARRSSS